LIRLLGARAPQSDRGAVAVAPQLAATPAVILRKSRRLDIRLSSFGSDYCAKSGPWIQPPSHRIDLDRGESPLDKRGLRPAC